MLETPRTIPGFHSAGPRRLSLATSHYRQFGIVSSPLATSSPSPMLFSSSAAAATLPDRLPLRRPKQPPQKLPLLMPQFHLHFPSSRTNTIRSTDLSSIYTVQPEEAALDERNAHLLQCIQMQQELINQATAAIALCRKKFRFSGTLQELSAQRLLLVSQERLALLNRQMDQLNEQRILTNLSVQQLDDIPESVDFDNEDELESVTPLARCTLSIDKMVITLNPSFSLKKIDKDSSFAFVVLCRHENTIYATQIANVLDVGQLRNNKVKFKELIVFEEMPQDFCVLIEVFAMKICKRMDYKWHCMWNFAAKTFRNLLRSFSPNSSMRTDESSDNSRRSILEGDASASASPTMATQNQGHLALGSEFHRCGYLHLNMETLAHTNNNNTFFLNDADYPMEGSVELFVRFAPCSASVQPPRPDSADVDMRFNAY
ncbi:hypothetical protein niasHT_015606 [Heterodera trifolii]|uniref:Anillin homology domain-containing protein n=1 Tax=Heterodera trifolii TaxID=157864 RepID=A0ABD2LDX7_9BILA